MKKRAGKQTTDLIYTLVTCQLSSNAKNYNLIRFSKKN